MNLNRNIIIKDMNAQISKIVKSTANPRFHIRKTHLGKTPIWWIMRGKFPIPSPLNIPIDYPTLNENELLLDISKVDPQIFSVLLREKIIENTHEFGYSSSRLFPIFKVLQYTLR